MKNIYTLLDEHIFDTTDGGEWLDCLFEDCESGEQFFVELRKEFDEEIDDFVDRCFNNAMDYFDEIEFVEIVPAEIAEMMGLDTY
jgi:hypothetical protein